MYAPLTCPSAMRFSLCTESIESHTLLSPLDLLVGSIMKSHVQLFVLLSPDISTYIITSHRLLNLTCHDLEG